VALLFASPFVSPHLMRGPATLGRNGLRFGECRKTVRSRITQPALRAVCCAGRRGRSLTVSPHRHQQPCEEPRDEPAPLSSLVPVLCPSVLCPSVPCLLPSASRPLSRFLSPLLLLERGSPPKKNAKCQSLPSTHKKRPAFADLVQTALFHSNSGRLHPPPNAKCHRLNAFYASCPPSGHSTA